MENKYVFSFVLCNTFISELNKNADVIFKMFQ